MSGSLERQPIPQLISFQISRKDVSCPSSCLLINSQCTSKTQACYRSWYIHPIHRINDSAPCKSPEGSDNDPILLRRRRRRPRSTQNRKTCLLSLFGKEILRRRKCLRRSRPREYETQRNRDPCSKMIGLGVLAHLCWDFGDMDLMDLLLEGRM